jgi:outer membrane protein OmpU
MKKILIASTALTMLAGVASADVTLSGSGYFGLQYDSENKNINGTNNTQLLDRLQIMINASKTTDSGLTFYGKYRIRGNAYQGGTTPINGPQVGVKAGGLDVSVGNVSDAIDSMSLFYNSEVGICGCGGETIYGWPFDGYSSRGEGGNGVLASYTVGSLIVRGSVMSNGNAVGTKTESALSVFDKFGNLSFELGWANTDKNFNMVTGVVEYAMGSSNIGLAYGTVKYGVAGFAPGTRFNTTTLYGNTTFGAVTVSAFVSNTTNVAQKATYGIGASYDLGSGAAIAGSVRTDNGLNGPVNGAHKQNTYADLGVTFKF